MTNHPNLFLCDAVYHGSRQINGALTPSVLSSLADAFFHPEQGSHRTSNLDKLTKGDRCQLQMDEERLKVNCNRRDEGFESDSDASSTHGSVERAARDTQSVKVIKDHVLRLEKLIRQDSGISRGFSPSQNDRAASLSSSSGAESEEEVVTVNHSSDKESTAGSLNTFWVRDILFCHVISQRPKVVIIVIKSLLTNVTTAHVFECVTSEAARTLYSSYSAANNKYKLDRYRNSRRMNDEKTASPHVSSTFVNNSSDKYCERETRSQENNPSSKDWITKFGDLPDDNNHNLRCKTLNTKSSKGVNLIEIKDGCSNFPFAMMQRTDCNGVTHIEIDSSPRSLPQFSLPQDNRSATTSTREALTALERLSLHSSNNPDSYLNYSGVTSSCPNSLIVASREIAKSTERSKRLRQITPSAVFRNAFGSRNDSMPAKEIKRSNNERRNRSRSEERKLRIFNSTFEDEQLLTHSLPYISSPRFSRKTKSVSVEEGKYCERQSRSRSVTRNRDGNDRAKSRNGKRQAPPPPPPRRHPDNPSLLLVPTKTGQEASKSFYPKEPHNIRGNKIVRIDYPIYPPWNINSDVNNNAPRVYYAPPSWTGYHEFHTSRNSDHHFAEMKKRSRSKSPARRPIAHRYIDAVSSTLNLSQRLKDFSGSVINSMKPTNNSSSSVNGFSREELQMHGIRKSKKSYEVFAANESGLKPVIKRGKREEPVGETRRVTFNSYATVQVIECI